MASTLTGTVSSAKRDKTITVSIASRETHPLYRKQYTKTRKYTAHDADNLAGEGDIVEIAPCRPISKTKTYKLVRIVEKYHGTVELKEDIHEVKVEKDRPADAEAKEEAQKMTEKPEKAAKEEE